MIPGFSLLEVGPRLLRGPCAPVMIYPSPISLTTVYLGFGWMLESVEACCFVPAVDVVVFGRATDAAAIISSHGLSLPRQ